MEFRYGYSRTALNWTTLSDGFNPTQLGFPSYIAAYADRLLFPGFEVTNYYSLGDPGAGVAKKSGFESHLLGINITKVSQTTS